MPLSSACQIQPLKWFPISTQNRWLPSSPVRPRLLPRKLRRLNAKRKKTVFVGHKLLSNGEKVSTTTIFHIHSPTMLRIEGNEVVTSRGARFPITHAKRGLVLVRAVMARTEDWHHNSHSCHLGHYTMDSMELTGQCMLAATSCLGTRSSTIAPAIEAFQEQEVEA